MAEASGPGMNGQGGSGAPAAMNGQGPGGGGQFLAHRDVMIVLPGLLLAILLAMLDNLIVSTALPRIVGDLGGVSHLSWVVTAESWMVAIQAPGSSLLMRSATRPIIRPDSAR